MTESKPLFQVIKPIGKQIPIILHLPHSGTEIPLTLYNQLDPIKREQLDETDWFLEQLYDFVSSMGIVIIRANYHRWVVDLNRDPHGMALYNDGRIITSVTPEVDFNGEALYSTLPSSIEKEQRIEKFHSAYFNSLDLLLKDYYQKFGKILIWDGHSIRRRVPGIQSDPFPDLILGTNDGKSCPAYIEKTLHKILNKSGMNVTLNSPFKGGYITRHLAEPQKNIYTVQLEMSKDLYMDDGEVHYAPERANAMKKLLKELFEGLSELI